LKKRFFSTSTVLVIIVACLFGAGLAVYRGFFMPNNDVVPAFSEGGLNVVVEGDVIRGKGEPKIMDGRILLPLDIVRDYIDPEINWDSKLHKLTITTADRVVRMKTDSLEAFVNNKPVTLNIPVSEADGSVLVPIEFLSELYNIGISFIADNNVVVVDFKDRARQLAEPQNAKAVVRNGDSIFNPIVKRLDSENADENELRVFGDSEKWYRVRTADGIVGFIEKKYVTVREAPAEKIPDEKEEKPAWKPRTGKLSMAWDYAYNMKINLSKREKIEGLDILSPTWFQVVGEDGAIKNSGDAGYVEWAHNNGYQVWALFSNSFGDPEKSGRFLRNTDSRDNAIRQVLALASLYKVDGINVDFENLLDSDKDALTQFVRELTPLLREQGVVVSIDVNTLGCYDRKALGEAVDFVVLMAYDQHWAGGSEAGSVAELDWVDRTVRSFLNVIPEEKLILGIPFYTRLWKEDAGEDGKIKLTSQALSMAAINKILKENKAPVRWDETSGQFYSEYKKEGATYKVWLEDENSINLRTSLVQKYGLAGAAAWRLEFELPSVWPRISGNLKTVTSYAEWEKLNQGKNYVFAN
jgi:spore germination protein YaaH